MNQTNHKMTRSALNSNATPDTKSLGHGYGGDLKKGKCRTVRRDSTVQESVTLSVGVSFGHGRCLSTPMQMYVDIDESSQSDVDVEPQTAHQANSSPSK